MFTVVVYEQKTRKIICCIPLKFENDTLVKSEDCILYNGFEFEVFANREPVFYEDKDGDMCLKSNCFIANSGDLL